MKLNLTFPQRLTLLFMLLILGLCITAALHHILSLVCHNGVAVARITTVAQDILAFILPAIVLAMLVSRLPAEFLMLNHWPSWRKLAMAMGGLCLLLPVVEALNYVSHALPWGEKVMEMEATADAALKVMLGPHTPANMILSIMIVGLLTGLAEELFFRGAMQQLLRTRPMNVHLAVWITAIVFSLMHAQPIGMVPRTVLGAYFGYVSVWSRSLWTAAICHAFNNSVALYVMLA